MSLIEWFMGPAAVFGRGSLNVDSCSRAFEVSTLALAAKTASPINQISILSDELGSERNGVTPHADSCCRTNSGLGETASPINQISILSDELGAWKMGIDDGD
jgi:hypothetical protein